MSTSPPLSEIDLSGVMPERKELDDLNAALAGAVKETLVHANHDGKVVVKYEQDVGSILDANKRQRDESTTLGMGRFKEAKKGGMNFHQAMRVPLTVVLDIKAKYGLDMMGRCTPDQKQRIYKIIQTEYPYCMTVPGRVF